MKPYTIIRPKTHDEWLAHRSSGIGSSEVGTILGLNEWETPYHLWRRKKGIDPPVEENFLMKAGHYLEDAVSRFFADETGAQIIKATAGDWIAVDTERPWLRVSPDRLAWMPGVPKRPSNKMIVECKTTQRTIDADNLPMHWFAQLQYQLMVMRLDHGALAWLTQGRDFGYAMIDRDDDFCEYMAGELNRFWRDYIEGSDEPPCVDGDDAAAKWMRQRDGEWVEADSTTLDTLAALKETRARIKELDELKKQQEDALKLTIAGAEGLITPDGKVLATWKAPAKAGAPKFDSARFMAEHPDEAKAYMTEAAPAARRFLIK